MRKIMIFLLLLSLVGCANETSIVTQKSTTEKITTQNIITYATNTITTDSIISVDISHDIEIMYRLIEKNTKARPGTLREVKWIVIHETANLNAGALNHATYLENNTKQSTSWHYTVDDTYIINHIPDEEVAWHAGDGLTKIGSGNYLGGGNLNGIGIEMCVNVGNDTLLTWRNTAKLVVKLLVKYDLTMDNVKKHQDFSGKICPKTIIENGTWNVFLEIVNSEYQYALEQ